MSTNANIVGSDTWEIAERRVRRHAPAGTPEEVIEQAIRETAQSMLDKAVQDLREFIYYAEADLLSGDQQTEEKTHD